MLGRIFHCGSIVSALSVLVAAPLAQSLQTAVAAEYNAVRRHPAVETSASVQRVIVKLRTPDATRVQAQAAAADSSSESAATHSSSEQARLQTLAQRAGLSLKQSREISERLHVLSVEPSVAGESPDEILARLKTDAGVEFAETDRRRYPHAIPNDPLYTNQWYLQKMETSAIAAVDAWDITTGGTGVVVAILDTGVRFDHPDLGRAEQGGRLLPGYDFVSADPGSPNSFLIANDGDGRDSDPSDPGDWISSTDLQTPRFNDCGGGTNNDQPVNSSWHGTRVAGIVGARTNNAQGIAGVTWSPLLLPVRVLGKCGGYDSDIIAAMRWAAGLHVAGVPDNTDHPAKIINLSLGSTDPCSQSYQNVIAELTARGVLVVASAGNETGHAVDSPANCPGVLGVSGLRHAGTKVGYSNIGPEVGISAPAGNCGNLGGACLFSIHTTVNLGDTTPGANSYTDQFNTNLGTSFSAPIVAATAALVRSVNTILTPTQVIIRLKQSAASFPTASGVSECVDPAVVGGDQLECNCTTATCGAGMLNAAAAVTAAQRPFVIVTANPTAPATGQTVTLDGSASFAAHDRTISTYTWTVVSTGGTSPTITNADMATASFTAPAAGDITLRLTITDDQGAEDSADVTVTTPAPPPANSPNNTRSSSGGGGGGGTFGLDLLLLAGFVSIHRLLRRLGNN